MEEKEYQELKRLEKEGKISDYDFKRLCYEDDRRWERHIGEILSKDEDERTESDLEDLDLWNDEYMRTEFTIVGGF